MYHADYDINGTFSWLKTELNYVINFQILPYLNSGHLYNAVIMDANICNYMLIIL